MSYVYDAVIYANISYMKKSYMWNCQLFKNISLRNINVAIKIMKFIRTRTKKSNFTKTFFTNEKIQILFRKNEQSYKILVSLRSGNRRCSFIIGRW